MSHMKYALGAARSNFNVYGSGIEVCWICVTRLVVQKSVLLARSIAAETSLAVMGCPLWNLASLRSETVTLCASGENVHFWASRGSSFMPSPAAVNASNTRYENVSSKDSVNVTCGSRLSVSPSMATVTVPDVAAVACGFAAAAGATVALVAAAAGAGALVGAVVGAGGAVGFGAAVAGAGADVGGAGGGAAAGEHAWSRPIAAPAQDSSRNRRLPRVDDSGVHVDFSRCGPFMKGLLSKMWCSESGGVLTALRERQAGGSQLSRHQIIQALLAFRFRSAAVGDPGDLADDRQEN